MFCAGVKGFGFVFVDAVLEALERAVLVLSLSIPFGEEAEAEEGTGVVGGVDRIGADTERPILCEFESGRTTTGGGSPTSASSFPTTHSTLDGPDLIGV